MPTLKDLSIEALKNLPPSASAEEIVYKIILAAQIMDGLKDAEEGRVISTVDLLYRVDSWNK
jgi:predicted transcriptional regulator